MDEAIKRLVSPVLDKAQAVLGTGFAAVLYGSAARGEYRPGVSDINLLLVADSLTPAVLRSLSGVLDELRRERQPPPLLIERNEWTRAVDVFPIEVTDMQLAREVLRGTDPVAGLRVDPADLRHALEQELRGKLLRLRQVYALHAADARALGEAAARTVGSVAALFRAALVLHGQVVPMATAPALAALENAAGIPTRPTAELWGRRRPKGMSCEPQLFEGYLTGVAAAVRVIDQFPRGGN